jgi:hypothetical protein
VIKTTVCIYYCILLSVLRRAEEKEFSARIN